MARGSDKVEQSMNAIVTEAWVTLDTRLFCENVIILSLEIANNFTKAFIQLASYGTNILSVLLPRLIVNLVSEAWCVDDGKRDAGSFFIKFQFCNVSACAPLHT